jgi:hypothetical protein
MSIDPDLERLREWLDRYGPELARWPEHERARAREWLIRVPAARAELAAAQRLETLLRELPAPKPAPALREAVLAAAPGVRPRRLVALRELWFMLGGLRLAGPAFAAALLLGITLGALLGGGVGIAEEPAEDLVELSQVDVDYADF